MKNSPILIVMLTHNDRTVDDADQIFEQCKYSKAQFWGMKEEPMPLDKMKQLYSRMKEYGKTTVLEVVAYTEEKCIEGAKIAVQCGCDILMGTVFSDAVNEICKSNGMKYMPFVGNLSHRPSILEGSIDKMIEEADRYLEKGVYGFDLLGYRYVGDAVELNRTFVSQVNAPVCIAGSINSDRRLFEIKQTAPWAFTIGGAVFEHKFGGTFCEQIDKVCEYMDKQNTLQMNAVV